MESGGRNNDEIRMTKAEAALKLRDGICAFELTVAAVRTSELRSAFATAQQKSFFELSEGMTPAQRGKLFVSMERFEEKVRNHLRRFQEGGSRRGRGHDGDDDDL